MKREKECPKCLEPMEQKHTQFIRGSMGQVAFRIWQCPECKNIEVTA